uniref:Repressor of RNA polymerase III transcription MAF1 n=1 Tax=Steinernema glaseri TaxID=37863 RepID=A0A1I7YZ58_9BILA
MKLLESERLESISSFLSQHAINCYLDVRAEAYSCKMCTNDKREWKRSIKSPSEAQELQPLSPPDYTGWPNGCAPMNNPGRRYRHISEPAGTGGSSISDSEGWYYDENGAVMVSDSVSRRTLFDLTNVLTNSYADYDFSGVNSESFTHIESVDIAKAAIDGNFTATVTGYPSIKEDLWNEINDQIGLHDCAVYSYIPDYKTDPFSEDGCVWSFNYIFVNKNLKRILFMACRSLNNADVARDLDVSAEQLWVIDP